MAPPESLLRVRTALKLTLWAWAAYWPAMGAMLLLGGMRDPVSVAVALASLAAFVLVLRAGAVDATASRSARELLLERPIYLVAGAIVVLFVGAAVPALASLGLATFALAFLGSLVLLAVRLVAHVNATGLSVFAAHADEMLLVIALSLPGALLVAFDAIVPSGAGNSAPSVALLNWLGLSYPLLALLASRGLREPLRLRRARKAPAAPAPRPLEA